MFYSLILSKGDDTRFFELTGITVVACPFSSMIETAYLCLPDFPIIL